MVVFILVLIHELGHFLFAKAFGVPVREFSVGFRPKIFSKKYKNTQYTLGAVPLGGFVDIVGMRDDEKDLKNGFLQQNFIKKVLILAGGVIFNIIFAFFVFICVFLIGYDFPKSVSQFVDGGEERLYISYLSEYSESVGLRVGDRIESFNNFNDFTQYLKNENSDILKINVLREDKKLSFKLEGEILAKEKNFGVIETQYIKANLKESIFYSSTFLYNTTKVFFNTIGNVFVSKNSETVKQSFAGPIKIAEYSANAASVGFVSFIFFLGLLSVSLALFNMIPLPILDGGLIFLVCIESIFKFKIPNNVRSTLTALSLIIILFLLIYVTKNDIGI